MSLSWEQIFIYSEFFYFQSWFCVSRMPLSGPREVHIPEWYYGDVLTLHLGKLYLGKNTKRGGFLDLFGLGQCRNRSNSFDDKVKHVTVVMEPKKRGLSLSWCWKLELYSSSKLCVTLFKIPYRWDSNWKSSAQESCAVLVLVGITVFSIKSIFKILKDFLPTMNFVTTCELSV